MNDDMENRSIRLDIPDRDWVRSVPIKAMFRPPEAEEIIRNPRPPRLERVAAA